MEFCWEKNGNETSWIYWKKTGYTHFERDVSGGVEYEDFGDNIAKFRAGVVTPYDVETDSDWEHLGWFDTAEQAKEAVEKGVWP